MSKKYQNWHKPDKDKVKIIESVKLFRSGKINKQVLLALIKQFALKKHVELKKKPIILELDISFDNFIENKRGYNQTLVDLYNSIL